MVPAFAGSNPAAPASLTFTPASLDAIDQGNIKDPQTSGLAVEVLSSGKKAWKYARRISGSGQLVRLSFGLYPVHSIANARAWAAGLNEQVELGVDPRETLRIEKERADMTVEPAHELYMEAVREGRASRAKRKKRPRTIREKLEIEPPRDCRRPFGLSYAAIGVAFNMA